MKLIVSNGRTLSLGREIIARKMRSLMRLVRGGLVLVLLMPATARAEGEARHIAASVLLTASIYVAMSALMGREQAIKGPALGAAVGMALATGLAVEAMQAMQRGDRRIDRMDMMSNVAGVAGAAAAIMIVDF